MYSRVLLAGPRVSLLREPLHWLLQWGSLMDRKARDMGSMSLEVFEGSRLRRYSKTARRSLIAMLSRRAIGLGNGPASHILVRPFVVFAARALGPGPTRLRLVKLAHNLDHQRVVPVPDEAAYADDDGAAAHPTTRAA
jgi:hypothetical protein